jgi:phage shock protein PspC (stress-responsive transcriptional regulator)
LRDERFDARAEGFAARFDFGAFLARVSFFVALFLEFAIERKTIA